VKPVKQIIECHMTGGGFDYLLKIRVRDMAEYREILSGVIGQLPMVEGTHYLFRDGRGEGDPHPCPSLPADARDLSHRLLPAALADLRDAVNGLARRWN
jgi:hypothetical protein